MTRIAKVADVDDPDEDADDRDDLCEEVPKVVDLLLERRLLADLGGDGLVNVSDGGLGAGGGDDGSGGTADDGRSLRARVGCKLELAARWGRNAQRRAC